MNHSKYKPDPTETIWVYDFTSQITFPTGIETQTFYDILGNRIEVFQNDAMIDPTLWPPLPSNPLDFLLNPSLHCVSDDINVLLPPTLPPPTAMPPPPTTLGLDLATQSVVISCGQVKIGRAHV